MTIEIDDPPRIRNCASCYQTLIWLWHPRRGWVALVRFSEAVDELRVHGCTDSRASRTWRETPQQPPQVREQGIRRVRETLTKINAKSEDDE